MDSTVGSAFVPVQVGQTIEFKSPESKDKLMIGRVVRVDASHTGICSVQVASTAVLLTLDLSQTWFKIVFEIGKLCQLSASMIGWHIEVIVSESQAFERAVIKRVDCNVNCAFICFETGKKEWIDLSLVRVKVLGHPKSTDLTLKSSASSASCTNAVTNTNTNHTIGTSMQNSSSAMRVAQPKSSLEATESIRIVKKELPRPEQLAQVDWYNEGGHVELCDEQGNFIEGAILCAKTDATLLLFNESHRFFEIQISSQPFKAILHGLAAIHHIPMGHTIEVYSAMIGNFHRGTVLKTAEVGKLTPVLFQADAVEWIDLSNQTFKLLFLRQSPPQELTLPVSPMQISQVQKQTQQPSASNSMALATEMRMPNSTNDGMDFYPLTQMQNYPCCEPVNKVPLYPILHVGQRVELYDEKSKQFLKYKVIRKGADHEYEFQQISRSARDVVHLHTGEASSPSSSNFRVTCALQALRCCRIAIVGSHWEENANQLVGQRVDVYNKSQRSVQSGKVVDINNSRRELLVVFRDQTTQWINCEATKVKLRLYGDGASQLDLNNELMHHEQDVGQHQYHLFEQEEPNPQSNKASASPNELSSTKKNPAAPNTILSTEAGSAADDAFADANSSCPRTNENSKDQLKSQASEGHQGNHDANADLLDDEDDEDGRFFTIPVSIHPVLAPSDDHSPPKPFPVIRPLDLSRVPRYHSSRKNSFSASSRSDGDFCSQAALHTGQHQSQSETPSARTDDCNLQQMQSSQASSSQPIQAQPIPYQTAQPMAVPANDEIWTEEFDATTSQVRYVNTSTGKVQRTMPLWIKRFDTITREVYLFNTKTHTIALPVGPLEAVRVLGSQPTTTTST